jgi:hypothetical protein
MLEIQNRTRFSVAIFPMLDRDRRDVATVLVKGTFELGRRESLSPAEAQVPVTYGDELHGDPETSSVRLESDATPAKKGTDVVLLGHAYARRSAATVDVAIAAGPLRKVVRVFGNRYWVRALGKWEMSSPTPFEQVPLRYERAFGGADRSDPDPAAHAHEKRNPVGTGFTTGKRASQLEGLALPNLEDPSALISSPQDRPAPAAFGFVGRSWEPRAALAGTYDERWRRERCPFPPDDFDDRFHHGASPGLISATPFRGGEPVVVTNASPEGDLRFAIPSRALEIDVLLRGEETSHRPVLDTVVIEPDEQRVVVCWRATVPCPRQFLFIDRVRVREGQVQ